MIQPYPWATLILVWLQINIKDENIFRYNTASPKAYVDPMMFRDYFQDENKLLYNTALPMGYIDPKVITYYFHAS